MWGGRVCGILIGLSFVGVFIFSILILGKEAKLRNAYVHGPVIYFQIAEHTRLVVNEWSAQDQLEHQTDKSAKKGEGEVAGLEEGAKTKKNSREGLFKEALLFDFGLIVGYVIFFGVLSYRLTVRLIGQSAFAESEIHQWIVGGLIRIGHQSDKLLILTGILDVLENGALWKLIEVPGNQSLAFLVQVLLWGKWGLLILLLAFAFGAIGFVGFLYWEKFVRAMFALRVPLLAFILLLGLNIAGGWGPGMIKNAWIVTSYFQAWVIGFVGVFGVSICVASAKIIWKYGPDRLGIEKLEFLVEWLELPSGKSKASSNSAIVPGRYYCLLALLIIIPQGILTMWQTYLDDPSARPVWFGVAWVVGVFSAAAVLYCCASFFGPRIQSIVRKHLVKDWALYRMLDSGYVKRTEDGRRQLHSEHAEAGAVLLVIAIVYFAGWFCLNPWNGFLATDTVPTVGYLLWVVMLATSILSALGFFLDRSRFPLFLAVLLGVSVTTFKNDYEFSVYPNDGARPTGLMAVLNKRIVDAPSQGSGEGTESVGRNGRVVTVICANGGGIQAAAWTSKVLHGLASDSEIEAGRFLNSVQMLSATSGGSVGVMNFLLAYSSNGGLPRVDHIEEASNISMESSLEETAWGIVYPDFINAIVPGFSFKGDRGRALEQAWRESSKDLIRKSGHFSGESNSLHSGGTVGPMLSDWMVAARDGKMPAVVFNSTDLTSGKQVFFSNIQLPQDNKGDSDNFVYDLNGRTFANLFKHGDTSFDIQVSTAVRLSATFPFVSPPATPVIEGQTPDEWGSFRFPFWRFGDGGYFDNAGLLAGIGWIRAVLKADGRPSGVVQGEKPQLPISSVLLLIIDGFSERADSPPFAESNRVMTELGQPVSGLVKVRSASQEDRGNMELQLLRDRYPQVVPIVIRPSDLPDPPLSWHLSESDKTKIKAGWTNYVNSPKMQLIRKTLNGGK